MPEKAQVEPYDFVPLVGQPQREPAVGHHRFAADRHNGRLECRLTAKTPIFVYDPRFARPVAGGHEQVTFPVFGRVAVISGTSLKGVIRSLVEAVEPSCFTSPTDWDEDRSRVYPGSGITRGKNVRVKLPAGFEHCSEKDARGRPLLCPACRLFGSLSPKGDWAWAGKVSISDARSAPGEYTLMDYLILDVLSTPKPEGRPQAYVKQDGTIQGRKFYRHRLDDVMLRALDQYGRRRQDRQNKTVQPVGAGSVFHFTVEYSDLSEAEVRLLLYGLALEEGLGHKVGMGKPLGLGSVQIEIIRWIRIDRNVRYQALGGGLSAPLEGEELAGELAAWLRPYREKQTANLKKLREILRPDPNVDVRYTMRWSPGQQRERR